KRVQARGAEVSVTGVGGSRSFDSTDPLRVLWDEIVAPSSGAADLPPFWAGAVGYASYDLVRRYEELPDANPDELGVPDMLFVQPELVVIFDHLKRKLFVVAAADADDPADLARAEAAVDAAYARLRGPLPGVPGD